MASVRQSGILAWMHLMRVYNKMQQRSLEHTKQYELTPAQFDVLAQLSVAEGITQQELARKLLVTKGNVCGLLDRMSAHDLVKRCDDPEDRRSNRLHLTAKGRALADKVVPAHQAFVLEQLAALSPEEQRFLQMLLRKLDRSLGSE